ncbi:MAG: pectate lyase [Sedimentisphaerales bacterium]|nr:pectate lyase [Sedimentisphaerales bacterium]
MKYIFIAIVTFTLISTLSSVLAVPQSYRPGDRFGRYWDDFTAKPDSWYQSKEGVRITNNVLSWQSAQGSWPKNIETFSEPFTSDPNTLEGTFDNAATTCEIRFLARAFRATGNDRCHNAVEKAVKHILQAQYPTGGWPQTYPPGGGYSRYITFNDNCMTRLMVLLREVAVSPDFDFLRVDIRKAAQENFNRGINCILKCQIKVDGKLTAWCAQHDEIDYSPRPARSYELVSISGSESVGILELLMTIENPSDEIIRAVKAGVEWFDLVRLSGIRVERKKSDRVLVKDSDAPFIWARFYEIGTNRPFFCGRDGIKKYKMSQIEEERRRKYAWYGYWPSELPQKYKEWAKKHLVVDKQL